LGDELARAGEFITQSSRSSVEKILFLDPGD
jgi:hypothetical protein